MTSTALAALRVAGYVAAEKLIPKLAIASADVPASVNSITDRWWSAVLGAKTPGAEVIDTKLIDSSSGTHARHRFALNWNDAGRAAGLPASVFTKTMPTVVTRMIGGFNGTARAEGLFYQHMRPNLTLESPLGYHSAFNRKTFAGINVLEDIVESRGATFCDHSTRVTREMADSVVSLLAQLHSHRAVEGTLASKYPFLANFADWFSIGSHKMNTEHYTRKALQNMGEELPAYLIEHQQDLWPATVRAARIHQQAPFSVLHSDVHIGNWYQNDSGQMGLLDWQCVTVGHWSRDVAYALTAALEVEDRRAWEADLLEDYLCQLEALTGIPEDREAAQRNYRNQMLHALWMWTITLNHSPLLPAMQPEETSRAMIKRISTAIADHRCLDL